MIMIMIMIIVIIVVVMIMIIIIVVQVGTRSVLSCRLFAAMPTAMLGIC
jgi:hypothetical protein